jgi:hypothetical protein
VQIRIAEHPVGLRSGVSHDHRLIALDISEECIRPGPIEVDVTERVIPEPVPCGDPVLQDDTVLGRVSDLSPVHEADGIADAVAPQDLNELVSHRQARDTRRQRSMRREIVDRNREVGSGHRGGEEQRQDDDQRRHEPPPRQHGAQHTEPLSSLCHERPQILARLPYADKPDERVQQERCVHEGKESVEPVPRLQFHERSERPPAKQPGLRQDVARGRRGAADDFRRTTERRAPASTRLLHRAQDAAEIHRDQQQVQRIRAKHVAPPVADAPEIDRIEQVVGYRGDREPHRGEAFIERDAEEKEKRDIRHGEGGQVMQAQQHLGHTGPSAPRGPQETP